MAMTQIMRDHVADVAFAGTTPAFPAPYYLALFKSLGTISTGSAAQEVQTSATLGYARQACALTQTSTGATVTYSNSAAETFTASGGAWADVTHVGLCASSTPGTNDVWIYGALTAPITNIGDGTSVTFAIGELDLDV